MGGVPPHRYVRARVAGVSRPDSPQRLQMVTNDNELINERASCSLVSYMQYRHMGQHFELDGNSFQLLAAFFDSRLRARRPQRAAVGERHAVIVRLVVFVEHYVAEPIAPRCHVQLFACAARPVPLLAFALQSLMIPSFLSSRDRFPAARPRRV